MVSETLEEKLLKVLRRDCEITFDIDSDWMTISTDREYFTMTQLNNIEKLLTDEKYYIVFIGYSEGMYLECYYDESLKGTDDGIVADPETSVKDVCRPETGK